MQWPLANRTRNNVGGQDIISNIDSLAIAMDKQGVLYVSDFERDDVRQYGPHDPREGAIVAGGNRQGSAFNQLNCPRNIFVDDDYSIYVSDRDNNCVMRWLKNAKKSSEIARYPVTMTKLRRGIVRKDNL